MREKAIRIFFLIALTGFALYFGRAIAAAPGAAAALLATSFVALVSLAFISREQNDRRFIIRLWLGALALRVLVAVAVYSMGLRDNIAPDWLTYDQFGNDLARYWKGFGAGNFLLSPEAQYKSGWGMYYYVAAVYWVIGKSALAIQLINCVVGANACVLIYLTAQMAYSVRRVSRTAGVLCAVAPSMVIWSAQGIKEPLIVFLLASILYLTLKLGNKFNMLEVILLLLALSGVYALRHYVFFVAFLASAASLLFAARQFSPKRMIQGSLAVLLLGTVFAYYGAGEVADKALDLQKIQSGRTWSAKVSGSGYGGDVDITDTRAAIQWLPLGTIIFLFAPFPWMIRNLNHVLMMPEMVVWWLASPWLVRGFWFAFRKRLRESLSLGLFTVGLTLTYALFLTNFGTAHRMRVQILGFFIIFISIGWELHRMKVEERRRAHLVPHGLRRRGPSPTFPHVSQPLSR
jgi:hypothetical protein